MGIGRNWTDEDIQYLEDNWGVISINTIAENLDRSINAINIKKNKMGLGAFLNNGEYITFNQLIVALGNKSYSYKETSWIRNRQFPIKYKRVSESRFKVVYLEDFWEWAEKNRTIIDWSKVEKNVIGAEPSWVDIQRKRDFNSHKINKSQWTKLEEEKLKVLVKQFRYTYSEIALKLNRTEGAIQRRICDLNLIERPLKADTHTKWTNDECLRLGEMIKQRFNYEMMLDELNKSVKAIRGKVYNMYLTEDLDKVSRLIGNGAWGDGRPERKISHRLLNTEEKEQVKEDMTKLVLLLKARICNHYDDHDYWQRELCMNWDNGCTAGESNCDACTSFYRIQPQYCRRCGATILKRYKENMCDKCKVDRKKQYQRKWMALNGREKQIN